MPAARADCSLVTGVADLTITGVVVATGDALFVCSVIQGTNTITSITWNGGAQTFTQVLRKQAAGVSYVVEVWELANPTPGSSTISVDYNTNPGSGCMATSIAVSGANHSQLHRTVYERNEGNGAEGLTVVDSQAGDLVLHACTHDGITITFEAAEDVATNGATKQNNFAGSNQSGGMSSQVASGSNTVCGVSTTATLYAQIAFAVPAMSNTDLSVSAIGEPVVGGSIF